MSVDVGNPILRACHCEMCRKQFSGAFVSIATLAGSEEIEGPTKSYLSSDWAERGFCERCGSTLWYRTREDQATHFAAGLFENAAGAQLKLEFFADNCPQGYGFAGDHRKMTTSETLSLFTGDPA